MERLKIAHMVYSYLPVTQNWIYTQIRNTPSCDHLVISLIEENPDQFPWNHRNVAFPDKKIITLFKLSLARYWIVQPNRFFNALLKASHPDVIHGHFSTEAWRIFSHAKKAHIPLVTTFYGLDVDKLSRRRCWKKRYPQLFDYGSAFIVEGPFMGERLKSIGCNPDKLHIIPIGVDPVLYRRSHLPQQSGNDTITLLYVGLHREKKGPLDAAQIFIAAAKRCPQLRLSVVGDGKYRKQFEEIIASAGLVHQVNFHGYCTFDTYRKILASCDIALVPSCFAKDGDSEGGAPVVCIEAQITGIPVVGTRHCDIPFIVHHGESGMLSAEHDINAMAKDLLLLANNRSLRLQMGQSGQQKALLRHDIKKQTAEVIDVYQAVTRNASGWK
jgi:colanic acid/amylovoran biosynthesis glycosyltransferase